GSLLMPALVNCHAHLELTGIGEVAPGLPFAEWIAAVIGLKRAAASGQFIEAAVKGARECRALGQGIVADVVSVEGVEEAYPHDGAEVIPAREVICPSAGNAAAISRMLEGAKGGVFLHSPYTVCAEAFKEAALFARNASLPIFTHLAESSDEVEFLLKGTGKIPKFVYGPLPVEPPKNPGAAPVEYLLDPDVLGGRFVAVHLVNISSDDVIRLARADVSSVLCPRSNRNLGVGKAPGRRILDSGMATGLGTDSSLSGGDLDLWGDVVAAVEDYGWSVTEALRAATSGGAAVLGVDGERGAFTPGLKADIILRKLGPGWTDDERILSSKASGGLLTIS
ncbi:MAG: hypothetical protein C0609_02890, partial [Deltaproteobacteria bacterium]